MEHQKLTFGDVAQTRILYFDKEREEACVQICDLLKIDNLPDYDSQSFYEKTGNTFVKKKILKSHKLSFKDRIFDDALIDRFSKNKSHVLFVFKGDVLIGIIHFSDYNQIKVLQAIQDDVLTFERRMRQLLFLNGYRNEDMLAYFKHRTSLNEASERYYSGRIQVLESKSEEMNQLGQFQLFSLKDLLEFSNDKREKNLLTSEEIEVNGERVQEIRLVNELRNMAMHGKNPIELDQDTLVFSTRSLNKLFQSLKTLRRLTYRVEKLIADHPDYRKSVEMENRSKLTIIHQHYPKALPYFVRE